MRATDKAILTELRKWLRNVVPWVFDHVLRELCGLPERDYRPAVTRLRTAGLIVQEHRVGVRGGAWKAVP
jgi:hypothetical protein